MPIPVMVPDMMPGMPRVPRRVIVPAMVVAVPPASRFSFGRDEGATEQQRDERASEYFHEDQISATGDWFLAGGLQRKGKPRGGAAAPSMVGAY